MLSVANVLDLHCGGEYGIPDWAIGSGFYVFLMVLGNILEKLPRQLYDSVGDTGSWKHAQGRFFGRRSTEMRP